MSSLEDKADNVVLHQREEVGDFDNIRDENFDLFQKGGLNDFVDPQLSKKISRKLDLHMLPILFLLYGVNYVDKAALGWAVLFSFEQDLGLVGTDYSWVSSIFYFGYLGAQYPASYLLQRYPAGRVIAYSTLLWGVIMLAHIGCKNYGGILVVRFLLGVAEAPILGGFTLFCAQFYTRQELVGKVMVFGSSQGLMYIVFLFVSYGLGHVTHASLSEWQLIYLVLGLCSFICGGLWMAFIPNSPGKARFLSEEERIIAVKRVSKNMMGTKTYDWKWSQAFECFQDPKSWLLVCYIIFSMIPNGGLTNFGNLVLADIVHSRLQSILVGMGLSFFSSGQMLIFSLFTSRYNNLRTIGMTWPMILAIAGLSAVYATENSGAKWGRVFAYWMINSYAVTWPFTLSIIGTNFAGHTKRATMSFLLLTFFAVGNIIGPFAFTSADAPKYSKALATNLGCFCACFVLGLILRVYFIYENKRRDKEFGAVSEEVSEDERLEGILNGMKDITDKQNKQFRFLL